MRIRQRGQAIVEFGLVALLFFTILFGIIDFGFLLNDWISVSTAAATGARFGALGNSPNTIYTQANSSTFLPGISLSNVTVTGTINAATWFSCTSASNCSTVKPTANAGDNVNVQVTADYTPLTPLGSTICSNTTCSLTSATNVRYEGGLA
jgi:Flp pilus assembly protein TadG